VSSVGSFFSYMIVVFLEVWCAYIGAGKTNVDFPCL